MSYLITGEVKTFSIDLFVSNEEHSISLEDVLNTFSLTDVGFNEQYDNVHSLGNNPILYFAYGTLTNPTHWRTAYTNPVFNYGKYADLNENKPLPIYLGKGEITSSIPSIHYEVEFEYTSANVIIQFTSSNHPILSVIEYTSLVTCNGSYSQMDIEILINNE